MDFKDYYQILGVAPDADEKTIKGTFRKLARAHHPDVNPGNQNAAERFKEINEAYQVLSDTEQRKKYDQLRTQYQQWQQRGGRPQDFNWQQHAQQPAGDGDVHVEYATPEDLEDLFGGESPYSDFFQNMFGGGRAPQGARGTPHPRRGRDLEYEVEVTLEEAFYGAKRTLQIGERRIEASIPRGVDTGSRVRLAAQGERGRDGGEAGDLYLLMRVLPHPNFEREGDDLYRELPMDFYTAALGGEMRVPTLDGVVMLTVPPRTQAGRSFRLRGKGMPHLGNPTQRGDLYARTQLVLPEPLSERELSALRELRDTRQQT